MRKINNIFQEGIPLSALLWKACLGTLLGGFLLGIGAAISGNPHLALGFLLGALLSVLNFLFLNTLVVKVLSAGGVKGNKIFWSQQVLRWIAFALIVLVLVRVSFPCLLGALGSYLWFLALLAWLGWRSARTGKNIKL